MIDRKIMQKQELVDHLNNLIQWDALEICPGSKKDEYLIPYQMNDAVEFYFQLHGCKVSGSIDERDIGGSSIWKMDDGIQEKLILRQPSGNIVTISYEEAERVIGCYQYHQIGHNWRKEPGEEYARRLVNIVCVIHDKVSYMEPEHVNEKEKVIAALAQFPPLISYSPINESIVEWYSDSIEGIDTAYNLALEAECIDLAKHILVYKTEFLQGKTNHAIVDDMISRLALPSNNSFWRTLYKKIEDASMECDVRDYGTNEAERITKLRNQISEKYRAMGYDGVYPNLYKEETEVFFAEEHPFTTLEWEDYTFRIYSIHVDRNDIMNCRMERE